MGDYGVFLAGSYRCLGVIRALVSPSKSVSLGTHNRRVISLNFGQSEPPA